jgi:hypothetical protein
MMDASPIVLDSLDEPYYFSLNFQTALRYCTGLSRLIPALQSLAPAVSFGEPQPELTKAYAVFTG